MPGLQGSYPASPVGTAEASSDVPSNTLNQSSLRDSSLHCRTIPALKCRATFTVSLRDTGGSSVGEACSVSVSWLCSRADRCTSEVTNLRPTHHVSGSSPSVPEALLRHSHEYPPSRCRPLSTDRGLPPGLDGIFQTAHAAGNGSFRHPEAEPEGFAVHPEQGADQGGGHCRGDGWIAGRTPHTSTRGGQVWKILFLESLKVRRKETSGD